MYQTSSKAWNIRVAARNGAILGIVYWIIKEFIVSSRGIDIFYNLGFYSFLYELTVLVGSIAGGMLLFWLAAMIRNKLVIR